jgi:dCMP deaminase
MKRNSEWWHNWFFGLADHVASASKDPSTKVGAVIVRPDRTIASVGYNGFPRGVEDVYTTRDAKLLRTVHAEANAILSAHETLIGYTIYVTPLHPCANCAAYIIQSGIKEVHYRIGIRGSAWLEHYEAMKDMFEQAGVKHQWHKI